MFCTKTCNSSTYNLSTKREASVLYASIEDNSALRYFEDLITINKKNAATTTLVGQDIGVSISFDGFLSILAKLKELNLLGMRT